MLVPIMHFLFVLIENLQHYATEVVQQFLHEIILPVLEWSQQKSYQTCIQLSKTSNKMSPETVFHLKIF